MGTGVREAEVGDVLLYAVPTEIRLSLKWLTRMTVIRDYETNHKCY